MTDRLMRTSPASPHRQCLVCGAMFRIPLVKRPAADGRVRFQYSRRRSCGTTCARILRSNAMERAHEVVRTTMPLAYQRWVQRDYSAMGKARHRREE